MKQILVILAASVAAAAASPEWPQWGGPDRNFVLPAAKPIRPWPESGPKVRWRRPAPFGSSSIVVDGKTLFTMYRGAKESEVVVALDAATGKTRWEFEYPAAFLKGMNMKTGSGPHTTPLVDGNRLYTVGVNGLLHCLDKRTGKVLWKKGLIEELGGNVMLRGYSNSPLRYKDTLIVTAGGKAGTLLGLDPKSGEVRWRGGEYNNSHSSPVLINVDGQQQVMCVVEKGIAGFDPDSGRVLWHHPHENRGGDITTTAIFGPDNIVFFSGAYQGGSRALRLKQAGGQTTVEQLWFHQQMRVHHSNVMRLGDWVYGANGDFGATLLVCANIRTGEIKWRERSVVRSNMLQVGSQTLLLDEDGNLHLATLSPDGVKVHAKFKALENLAWTPPSLDGRMLYLRDRKQIVALELDR